MKKYVLICFLAIPFAVHATTWGETKVDDPIKEGKKCTVHEPYSWGGYIYNWPSKYDLVFWPHTDHHGIWFCKKSGYISFITDFEDIEAQEREEILEFLKKNKIKKPDYRQKLKLLEDIYALRDLTASKKNKLLRIFARLYQNLDDLDKANEYRKLALTHIKKQLDSEITEGERLEYLYVAANYSRQFGNAQESDQYLAKLLKFIQSIENPELKDFGAYLAELSQETSRISMGGKIDPTSESGT